MARLLSGGITHKAAVGQISLYSERDSVEGRLGALEAIG
jgi:hypothetical protein